MRGEELRPRSEARGGVRDEVSERAADLLHGNFDTPHRHRASHAPPFCGRRTAFLVEKEQPEAILDLLLLGLLNSMPESCRRNGMTWRTGALYWTVFEVRAVSLPRDGDHGNDGGASPADRYLKI